MIYNYKIESDSILYKVLFNNTLSIKFDEYEALLYLEFVDTNKNYTTLIDMQYNNDKVKFNLIVDSEIGIIRTHILEVLLQNYTPNYELDNRSRLKARFKVVNSQIDFNGID